MPPARRARGAHRAAPPYRRCWLHDGGLCSDDEEGEALPVPHDALSPVLARLPSAADVVRSAATCRRWAHLVAKDAAALSGALPQLPCLTLGILHQEDARTTARRLRAAAAAAAHPCFVPTAAAARLIGLHHPSRTALADAVLGLGDNRRDLFEHARPVAARNGWLVLELRQEHYTDGLSLCVCNPMRGDMAMLPPLAGADKPGDYACALYTGHDLDTPRPLSAFFRLLIVYNRRSFTALRSYSPDTGRWSIEGRRSWGPKIASLPELGQSIVVGGVAYWLLRRSAFAVRVDTPEPTEVPMPPTGAGISNLPPSWRSLGVDPDGKLIYIDAALCADIDEAALALGKVLRAAVGSDHLVVTTRSVFCPGSGDDGCSGEWQGRGICIRLKQLKVRYVGFGRDKVPPFGDKINLRWFCEKSGNLLFTLGEGTGSPGAFLLNMATGHVEKVAEGVECDSWRNFVGYEMDGAAYLASISRR